MLLQILGQSAVIHKLINVPKVPMEVGADSILLCQLMNELPRLSGLVTDGLNHSNLYQMLQDNSSSNLI